MSELLTDKVVVVTGGTGSIGSELVRQALAAGAAAVRVLSRDEARQAELAESLGRPDRLRLLIGDVRDITRVRRAFREADVVFHAAALKQVPSCEYNPFEAVRTNVVGTEHVIQAATDAGVSRLVGISTDKAVSPGHTMGATKLLAERLLTAVNQWTRRPVTACVRFGNVLGSRGSVVPLVRGMIARGEPVRLTDPAATRFSMTIPQAVRLVLLAATRAEGGETYILRMPRVRLGELMTAIIADAARRLGLDPARVPEERVGLRAGERLHERLAMEEERPRLLDRGEFFELPPSWRKDAPTPASLGLPEVPDAALASDASGPGGEAFLSVAELTRMLGELPG
jgi:FlaA1/EpsC-like NDP-sugar epimerase